MTITSGVVFTSAASAVVDSSMGVAVGKAAYDQGVTSDSDSVIARRTARGGLCNFYTGFWFDSRNDWKSTAGGYTTSESSCDHATSGYMYRDHEEKWSSVGWVGRNWCADFAKYIFKWAGADTEHLNGLAASFKTYGVAMGTWHRAGSYIPRRGDAVMYDWDHDGDIDHVGIVTSWYADNTDGTYGSVEGNRGGGNGKVIHVTDQDNNGASVYGFTTPVA
ncbi:CHAP domain-containing protein [Actinoplanes sp. NPDC051475]|uniref:CHAP domain-containing protein n=1 Tax=Actinoplanes sp. NPDC051475 TaxID=3157225 RepID=UPI00344F57DD